MLAAVHVYGVRQKTQDSEQGPRNVLVNALGHVRDRMKRTCALGTPGTVSAAAIRTCTAADADMLPTGNMKIHITQRCLARIVAQRDARKSHLAPERDGRVRRGMKDPVAINSVHSGDGTHLSGQGVASPR